MLMLFIQNDVFIRFVIVVFVRSRLHFPKHSNRAVFQTPHSSKVYTEMFGFQLFYR